MQLVRVTSVNNKVHIEIIVYNWSWSVYTVICHRFVTSRNHCKRLFVKLTIKFLKKKNCAYFSFVIIIFLLKKLCKCQLLGDTTISNFIHVCMIISIVALVYKEEGVSKLKLYSRNRVHWFPLKMLLFLIWQNILQTLASYLAASVFFHTFLSVLNIYKEDQCRRDSA